MKKFQLHLEDGTILHRTGKTYYNMLGNYIKQLGPLIVEGKVISPIKNIFVWSHRFDSDTYIWMECDLFSIKQVKFNR